MRNGEKKRKKVFNKRLQFIEKNQNTSLKYLMQLHQRKELARSIIAHK